MRTSEPVHGTMDGRVKPGHDDWKIRAFAAITLTVMPGLEPGIHGFFLHSPGVNP